MTEGEWLACTDPALMLEFLRDKASGRKLRLFACACCRRIWRLLRHTSGREAVETTERNADGGIAVSEWEGVRDAAYETMLTHAWSGDDNASRAAVSTASANAWEAAFHAAATISVAVMDDRTSADQEDAAQADLIRCIFGNPFRNVRIDPAWTAWNDGTVPKIAAGNYEERAFDRLPILADALLDAGCDVEQPLEHCRSAGPHARGCFALDALLGNSLPSSSSSGTPQYDCTCCRLGCPATRSSWSESESPDNATANASARGLRLAAPLLASDQRLEEPGKT